jgi:uncharacterized protein YkwD
MRFALVNLELPINRTAEAIVRNHSTHRALDQQFRMANPTRPDVFRFVTADITGEAHEALLFFLLAGHANLAGVNDDNEIAGIDVRGENSLLFSAQKVCRFDRDATEHLIFGIDQPPFAVNFVSFSGKRLHQRRGKGTEATGHERHCQPEESAMKRALRCFMEIIMRLAILAASTLFFPLSFGHAKDKSARAENEPVSAASVIRELNLARENPKLYATFVAKSRPFRMIERGKAVDEAVRFLQKAHPLPALTSSPGMSRAAADHCAEQVEGQLGHEGSDRSHGGDRISRYGSWSSTWGENISYSRKTAREVVLALIIDDGIKDRGHRKNIFNPKFSYAGAAFGPHARYRTVCTIDFAGGYAEHSQLVAKNP